MAGSEIIRRQFLNSRVNVPRIITKTNERILKRNANNSRKEIKLKLNSKNISSE